MASRYSLPAGYILTASLFDGSGHVRQLEDESIGGIVTNAAPISFGPYLVPRSFIASRNVTVTMTPIVAPLTSLGVIPSAGLTVATFAELATVFGYAGSGRSKIVTAGDIVQVLNLDVSYTVLASAASAFDLNYTATGGIKVNLNVTPNGYLVAQTGGDLAKIFEIACRTSRTTGTDYAKIAPSIWLRPGTYTLNTGIVIGTGQTGDIKAFKLAATPGTVRIVVADNVDAITITGDTAVPDLYVSGITFDGGDRHIRYDGEGATVVARKTIRDCKFIGFSKSAISSEQTDSPYWDITGNTFQAKSNVEGTISIAIGGLLDNSFICKNSFLRSWIDILIDGGIDRDGFSGTLIIDYNDFINFGSITTKSANIWLIPGSASYGTNSGWATSISHNKFGSENYNDGWTRILVAMKTGTGPRDTFDISTSFTYPRSVAGVRIVGNRFSSYSSATGPQYIIESYVGKLHGWTFSENYLNAPTFVLNFTGGAPETGMMDWIIGDNRGEGSGAAAGPWLRFSNVPMSIITNSYQQVAGVDVVSSSPIDVGLINDSVSPPAVFSGATRTVVTGGDVFGGDALYTISCPIAVSGIAIGMTGTVGDPTQAVVQIDLKKAGTLPLDFVEVYWNVDGTKCQSRRVELTSTTQTVEMRAIIPSGSSYRQIVIIPSGWSDGVKQNFIAGRIIGPIQTRGTINGGHIRTFGTGAWNGAHVVMGAFHLWIDASSRLRIKNGAPASDTDGTIVGVQT
jgi:hypothetical protein